MLTDFWQKIIGVHGHRSEEKYCTALDIGTEYAKALVFEMVDGVGIIRGVGREKQGLSHMQSGTVTDIEAVVENCATALDEAERMAGFRPDGVVVGIAGELVKGSTSTVREERRKPQAKITEGELRDLIQRLQRQALSQARASISWETGLSDIDVRLVHAAIIDVKIDNYRVTNPINFQGKDVSVSIFNAFAPLVHLGAIQTVTDQLGLDLWGIIAEPYAVARCLGNEQTLDLGAIFIDVGGGTTDVALVRHGGIEGTKMFGLGGRAFTKRIADHLGIPFAKAEGVKIDYSSGVAEPGLASQVKELMLSDAATWLGGVQLMLDELAGSDILPPRIYLCGGGSALPEIREVMERFAWTKELPFGRKPEISMLTPKMVAGLEDKTGLLVDQQDVTPMSLAYQGLMTDMEIDLVNSMLKKVLRLMKV